MAFALVATDFAEGAGAGGALGGLLLAGFRVGKPSKGTYFGRILADNGFLLGSITSSTCITLGQQNGTLLSLLVCA